MPNKFNFVISAIDKTTAVVNKINQSIGAVTKPIIQVQSAVGRLSKEMGVDRLGRSLGDVGRAARDVAGQVTSIVAPMAAVAGVGSVAAVAALAVEWGKLGAEVARTSETIGVSSGQLQGLRGAAQVSGVTAESLTSGIKSLGDTMEDALYGRNQGALAMMNRLGIQMKMTAGGAVDSSAAFMALADQIARIKSPQVQGLVARTFGLEGALPLLRKGSAGIAQLQAQVQATGAVMSGSALKSATEFYQSLGLLQLSVQGLRNSIGEQLGPVVTPLVDQLATWIAANRELISTKVGDFAKGVADAVRQIDWRAVVQGAKDFAGGIETVVDWLGGWKNAAIAVGVVMAGPLITSVLNLTTAVLRLGITAIPVVVRGLGVLGVAARSVFAGSALRAGLFASRVAGLAAGVPVVSAVMEGLSGAFVAVGAAIEATPIGWIITGIGAIGLAGYELYRHWSDIGKWWHKLWGDIGNDVARSTEKVKNASAEMRGAQVSGGRGAAMLDAAAKRKEARKAALAGGSAPTAAVADAANGVRTPAAVSVLPAQVPLGIRQNNPGNLRSWGSAAVVNGYAQFATPIEGLSAAAGNLQAYGKHGWNTIDSIVDHWAPWSDRNNEAAYKADLVKTTGFGLKDQLNLNDPRVLQALIPAITKHENGQNPYSAGLIAQAVASRLNQPVGVASGSVPTVGGVSASPQLAAFAKQMGISIATPSSVSPAAPVQTPYATLNQARIAAANDAAASSVPAPAAAAGAVLGKIEIDINLPNAPAGTSAKVRTSGPISADVRIGHSMPDAGTI